MSRHLGTVLILIVVAALTGVVIWRVETRENISDRPARPGGGPAAVEIAPVQSGVIRDRRVLTGTLEAPTRFIVAAKVGGLIQHIEADIGDRIERNQVVARIEDAEFVQAVAQAEAELAVRRAAQAQASATYELAEREYQRALVFMERAMASESELDEKRAARESTRAALSLAEAQVAQAQATLELARIRLSYTHVRAEWLSGPESAIVGERFQDAGNNVQPNTPILSVVTLDPLTAVVTVTERDYARLRVGQPATLLADAAPGMNFEAVIERIAPVFRESSRQARVELRVANPEQSLKPGMFVRIGLVLEEQNAETIVPLAAVVRRRGVDAVFTVDPLGPERTDADAVVRLVPIRLGVIESDRVSVTGDIHGANVVVLGHQLIEDGSLVRIPQALPTRTAPAPQATVTPPAPEGAS